MLEGTSGEMKLPDECEDNIARFIEWAYTSHYSGPPSSNVTVVADEAGETPKGSSQDPAEGNDLLLMAHARLYVFADRFNIQRLKQQTYDKLTARIATIGVPDTRWSKLAIVYLISYAFENLPKCKPIDPLLAYLGMYASWSLDSLRMEPEFFDLLESDVDFMKELFVHVRKGIKAPWGAQIYNHPAQRCFSCLGGRDYELEPRVCYTCRATLLPIVKEMIYSYN